MIADTSSDSDSYSSTSSFNHDSEQNIPPISDLDIELESDPDTDYYGRPIRPRNIRQRPVTTSEESEEDLVLHWSSQQPNNLIIRPRPVTTSEESEEESDSVINLPSQQQNNSTIRQCPQSETEDSYLDLSSQQRNNQNQQQYDQNLTAEHVLPALENFTIQQQNNLVSRQRSQTEEQD